MGIQLANGNTFFIFKKTGVIDIERSLDYFYGQAGELFSFYRIPKALFQEQRFQTLSTDAKTLYGILLDRMSLSAKNGWLDEQGRVFIIFTIEDVKRALCCADNKATKMLRELEEFGLIERKRRGLGKPSLVYVKNFSAESLKSIFQNRDFNDSGGFKSASQDPAKSRCNKTEENNTEKSETNPFYSEEDDGMSKREQLEEYFSQSLEIETLLRLCPDDEDDPKGKVAEAYKSLTKEVLADAEKQLKHIGNFLNSGIDQFLAFSNALNKEYIEVLDLYVYNLGIGSGQISFSVAVGVMKSIIALILFGLANTASKKIRGTSVF